MGTVFSIEVRDEGVDERALDDLVSWLRWVDATFSTYKPDSEISRLSRGELARADCDPRVQDVLRLCDELEGSTDGYFSARAGGGLDPSGVVKGWAIEKASDRLRASGSANHCVNGGGDVQCAGDFAPGQPWRVGVTHPLQPGKLAGIVVGTDLAVATSGTAERGEHVLDPHTGASPAGLASVTVVGRRLTYADAYATAAFAMGRASREWLENLPGHWGFAITADGGAWRTSGFVEEPAGQAAP